MLKIQIESQSIATGKLNGDYMLHQELPNGATLILLADGMGSLSSPEIASQTICEAISEYFLKAKTSNCTKLIHMSIEFADKYLAKFCKENKCKMGVAITLVYIKAETLFYASLGDVRLYYKNTQNKINQLTNDHVIIQGKDSFLTSCIRGRGFRNPILVQKLPLNIGDSFLLCSDGYYTAQDISSCLNAKDLPNSPLADDDSSAIRIKVL